eukprot:g1844.t1
MSPQTKSRSLSALGGHGNTTRTGADGGGRNSADKVSATVCTAGDAADVDDDDGDLMRKFVKTRADLHIAQTEIERLQRELARRGGDRGAQLRQQRRWWQQQRSSDSGITIRDIVHRHRHLFGGERGRGGGSNGMERAQSHYLTAHTPARGQRIRGFTGSRSTDSDSTWEGELEHERACLRLGSLSSSRVLHQFSIGAVEDDDGVDDRGNDGHRGGGVQYRDRLRRRRRRGGGWGGRSGALQFLRGCLARAADGMRAVAPRRRVRVCINGKWTTVSPWIAQRPLQRLVRVPLHVPGVAAGHVLVWQLRGACVVRRNAAAAGSAGAVAVPLELPDASGIGAGSRQGVQVWFEFEVQEPNARAGFSLKRNPFSTFARGCGGGTAGGSGGLGSGLGDPLDTLERTRRADAPLPLFGPSHASIAHLAPAQLELAGNAWHTLPHARWQQHEPVELGPDESGSGRAYSAGAVVRGTWCPPSPPQQQQQQQRGGQVREGARQDSDSELVLVWHAPDEIEGCARASDDWAGTAGVRCEGSRRRGSGAGFQRKGSDPLSRAHGLMMAGRRGDGTVTVSFTVRVYAPPSAVGLAVDECDEDEDEDEDDEEDEEEPENASDSDEEEGYWECSGGCSSGGSGGGSGGGRSSGGSGGGGAQLCVFGRASPPPLPCPTPAHSRDAPSEVRTADLLQF